MLTKNEHWLKSKKKYTTGSYSSVCLKRPYTHYQVRLFNSDEGRGGSRISEKGVQVCKGGDGGSLC